ncbi:helix-turn-helix domain-containing protein [Corynebacterium sanguinis]|uniref:helix-turn-helix transcriptional regulator n=1 Tax=Corynebacterium sanguinis TaxID=2594913 RepID=UPI001643A23D|nr:helix-turn-helix transcriptional regulator [Corynebacterium sanguinis]
MDIEKWFNDLTGNASLREAAETSGVSKSTLSRNLDAGRMTPETIIVLCRAFNRSPITGLIENGYIFAHEVDGPDVAVALEKATNEQLLDEIMRRSDPQARYLFGEDEDTVGLAPDAEVFDFPGRGVDFTTYRGVADSSPEEGEGYPDDYEP